MKRYKISLTHEKRQQLVKLIASGIAPDRKLIRDRFLLTVD